MNGSIDPAVAVLVIGCSTDQRPQISNALRNGYKVVTIGNECYCSDLDHIHLYVSTHDLKSAILSLKSLQEDYTLSAVLCRASGYAAVNANKLSKFLGTISSNETAFDISYSKSKLYEFLSKEDIPSIPVISKDIKKIEMIKDKKMKIVIKPDAPLIGKKDTIKIENIDDCDDIRIENIVKLMEEASSNKEYIIQPYIEGSDFYCLVCARNGKILDHYIFQEHNYFTRMGLVHEGYSPLPIRDQKLKSELVEHCSNLSQKLLINGFVSYQFRLDMSGQIYCYEVNTGLGGDNIADFHVKKFTLENLFEKELNIMTGHN